MQADFLAYRERYYSSPNKQEIMDEIITRFFTPLVDGFWERHAWRFKNLDEHTSKPQAIVQCFLKFDNYDPAKGSSYSYFTQIISNVFFHDNRNEALYRNRFINESSLDLTSDDF